IFFHRCASLNLALSKEFQMNKFVAAISVIVVAVGTVMAASSASSSRSAAEDYVLEKLRKGEPANFDKPAELSSEFIIDLITNPQGKFDIRQHLVTINNAVIDGDIQLLNEE